MVSGGSNFWFSSRSVKMWFMRPRMKGTQAPPNSPRTKRKSGYFSHAPLKMMDASHCAPPIMPMENVVPWWASWFCDRSSPCGSEAKVPSGGGFTGIRPLPRWKATGMRVSAMARHSGSQ